MTASGALSVGSLTSNAYVNEYTGGTSRYIAPGSFMWQDDGWRQNNFQSTITGSVTSPFLVSVNACDIFGEPLEKWVSIYDDNNVLAFDSGWTTDINEMTSRNPLYANSTMHVIIRLRYKNSDVPLTPNVMTTVNFTMTFTRREEVTQPAGWNETTTATLPDVATFPTTSVTAPELEDIPLQVVSHADLFSRLFAVILREGDILWIVGASLILAFSIWLLYGK